jgi:very-short-patch-repair endonuclease
MNESWFETAARQAGAISLGQLREADVSRRELAYLTSSGLLVRVRRGLYLQATSGVGFAVPPTTAPRDLSLWRRKLWLALLAAGEKAVVYRRSAATWWGLDGIPPGAVEVAVPPGRHPRASSAHRVALLPPEHVMTHNGLAVTTPARTLVDLGSAVDDDGVERALESALRLRLVRIDDVDDMSNLAIRGAFTMKRVLSRRPAGAAPTESDAETLFLQIARHAGLPDPERQFTVRLGGRNYRLDDAWPAMKFACEVDGYATHSDPAAFLADLRRQNLIILDGWMILRFSYFDIARNPSRVTADLTAGWIQRGGVLPARSSRRQRPAGRP